MSDRVGQQFGNYQLIQFLGKGHFAEVYLGGHIHLGTLAAVKVLQTRLMDVDAFRTEARIVAHLIHPNIVRVLEFGMEDEAPFLVMDFAPYGTLRQSHPKGGRIPLPAVFSLSPAVEQVVMRAIAKDADKRFESVQGFAVALEQASLLDERSTFAQPSPTIEQSLPETPAADSPDETQPMLSED